MTQPDHTPQQILAALRHALNEWEFKREIEANRNKDVTPQWVYDARYLISWTPL